MIGSNNEKFGFGGAECLCIVLSENLQFKLSYLMSNGRRKNEICRFLMQFLAENIHKGVYKHCKITIGRIFSPHSYNVLLKLKHLVTYFND